MPRTADVARSDVASEPPYAYCMRIGDRRALGGGYSEREVALKPTSHNMAKRSAQYHMKAIGSRVLTAQLAADPPLLLGCKGGDAPRPFCR